MFVFESRQSRAMFAFFLINLVYKINYFKRNKNGRQEN